MSYSFKEKLLRASKKSPTYILKRSIKELTQPLQKKKQLAQGSISHEALCELCECQDISSLWQQLAHAPYPFNGQDDAISPALQHRIDMALAHQVDFLGSGVIELGENIAWNKDYISGKVWDNAYFSTIQVNDLKQPSDVKFPWELSRFQWLLPLAQGYRITANEQYAQTVKSLIIDWINKNPYAMSVNWSCTMDVALRAITWIYCFYSFCSSPSWQDPSFQQTLLTSLFIHGRFCQHNIEMHEPNNNHYLSDAAGLTFIGLFFHCSTSGRTWASLGLDMLEHEIGAQMSQDGAGFEGSIPYHRLSSELFFYSYCYAKAKGIHLPQHYQDQLINMAHYIDAYSRPDGSIPIIGDADDGRVLPFQIEPINQHYYLVQAIAHSVNQPDVIQKNIPGSEELKWLFDTPINTRAVSALKPTSAFMPGYFVMQNETDHVFIDCAEVGMNGRGGHGHNDCLSFTAMLCDETLIVDRGCYVYTKDPEARNAFRATDSHNTVMIDEREINDFVSPSMLWDLQYQAIPRAKQFARLDDRSVFTGSHSGYDKLKDKVLIEREISLMDGHCLFISDRIRADHSHQISIPYHFAADVEVEKRGEKSFLLRKNGKEFVFAVESHEPWQYQKEKITLAPTYGKLVPSTRLVFRFKGTEATLKIAIAP